jgi:hypothetical protein
MPAIGATLREWMLYLLLCSIPTPAYSFPANETVTGDVRATASSSTTTLHASSAASSSAASVRTHVDLESACPYRTINYITHTLPQQCAKATWSAPGEPRPANGTAVKAGPTPSSHGTAIPEEAAESSTHEQKGSVPTASPHVEEAEAAHGTSDGSKISLEPEQEQETDSPLDNANFLSFEEWKNRNLAQVGQSPENVGGRAVPSNQAARRRPVNVNALDSLGDEAEIELDFSGFGNPSEGDNLAGRSQAGTQGMPATKSTEDDKKAAPSSWALSKDAGKTCKERFNYASFDCAATILKTNKQAKSATSVLVENKDSYMLNECSAGNKFIIVELCDDILIDTVVLANYEFFSSMFRHFRVSVSDRYPVKMERWRTLATFEARNSRDMQPFLINEPQIWARYVRIEFLTQYGNEFYCPLSLLRVHGTTMMEQFRREEEEARGLDDDADLEAESGDLIKQTIGSGPIPEDQVPVMQVKSDSESSHTSATAATTQSGDSLASSSGQTSVEQQSGTMESSPVSTPTTSLRQSTTAVSSNGAAGVPPVQSPSPDTSSPKNASESASVVHGNNATNATSVTRNPGADSNNPSPTGGASVHASASSNTRNISKISQTVNDTVSASSSVSVPKAPKASSNNTAASGQHQSQARASSTQPNPAVPSTQESFFKSIHKRLLYLEANSTLSLQYIEEQSRILRDAFMKVEKRQLSKTEKFLDHLNSTVMHELKSFRTMYDQLWQSTVIEIESMKERQKDEIGEIGTRLALMAEELVWQKRMAVVQSTLLLLCLGLVLFVRSGTLGSAADVPIVQQLGSKYTSFFESSPPRSPPETGIARRRRTFRNMWRSDTSAGLSDHQSDGVDAISDVDTDGARSPVEIEFSPPTPDTPSALEVHDLRKGTGPGANSPDYLGFTSEKLNGPDDQARRLEVLETQSGPATPNGSRDSRPSWEEVDRAMDQLKAVKTGQPSPRATKKDRDRKKKRSPLRRAHSSFDGNSSVDGTADDSSI